MAALCGGTGGPNDEPLESQLLEDDAAREEQPKRLVGELAAAPPAAGQMTTARRRRRCVGEVMWYHTSLIMQSNAERVARVHVALRELVAFGEILQGLVRQVRTPCRCV